MSDIYLLGFFNFFPLGVTRNEYSRHLEALLLKLSWREESSDVPRAMAFGRSLRSQVHSQYLSRAVREPPRLWHLQIEPGQEGVLVSWCCHNKVPQTGSLNNRNEISHGVGAGSPVWGYPQVGSSWGCEGESVLRPSPIFWWCWHSLVFLGFCPITLISDFTFPWCSPCVCASGPKFPFFMRTPVTLG